MTARRFIQALAAGGWFLLIAALPTNGVEPFAQVLEMRVIDPALHDPGLEQITAFHRILAPRNGRRIFASFVMRGGGPGVLVLDADSLAVVDVLRADELELDISDRWRAATVIPAARPPVPKTTMNAPDGSGVVDVLFCASSPIALDDTEPVVRFVYLSTDGGGQPRTVNLSLPEIPSAIAPIIGRRQLLIITRPSNFAVRVDAVAGEVLSVNRDIFPFIPYEYPPGRCLKSLADGQIYGSFKGRLFSYLPPDLGISSAAETSGDSTQEAPEDGFFVYLGLLPCEYGHLSQVALSAAASDGAGMLVGGTAADGYLFTVDTRTHQVRPWGKPTDGTEIRSLVHVGESGFWGLAVTPGQTTRIFNFRPDEGVLKDYGVPAGMLQRGLRRWTWYAYRIADMAVLPDGRMLLAEQANQAKLLVFDPSKILEEPNVP